MRSKELLMSSPFASHRQSPPLSLPWDAEAWAVVRCLTGREVEAAEREHMRNLVNGKSSRGWAGHLAKLFSGEAVLDESAIASVMADPLRGVDRLAVVRAGLVSWSYGATEPHMVGDAKRLYDPVGDLDDDALEFLAREVWRQTKPYLFQTAEELEAARKNG
jgi:PhoPQ-activated pathogenicity-related protein